MDEMEALALAAAASKRRSQRPQRNPDGTYGQPPEGMVTDPRTGQMTERVLMANAEQNTGVNIGESALLGVGEGTTFGGSDEMMGALRAALPGQGTAKQKYEFGREHARALSDASRAENPWTHGIGEAVGAGATALSYGLPALAGRGLMGSIVAGAGVGGVEGLTYGALSGEGGAENRAKNAAKYGTAGLALGGAVPLVTAGGKQLLGMGRDIVEGGVDTMTGRASQRRANKALGATVARSGKSVDDVADALISAQRDGQPQFVAMDALGDAGQRRASAINRSSGDGSTRMRDFIDQRQIDNPERVAGFVSDAFDGGSATAKATRATLKGGRDAAADLDFGAIRAGGEPVDVRGVISKIDSYIEPFQKADISSPTRRAMEGLKKQLTGGSDPKFELSDFDKVFTIRKAMRDQIDVLFRQGKTDLARDLKEVRKALDEALGAANPTYRQAMDDFAQSSRVMDAVDLGQGMVSKSGRAADNVDAFNALSADQQAAARVGYGDARLKKIENTAEGTTNTARDFTSSKARAEADAMAIDPEKFRRQVDRETAMTATNYKVGGGSRTADNQADIKDLEGMDLGFIANLMRGNTGEMLAQTGQRGINIATGMNKSTRDLIADALMSGDVSALRGAVAQVENSDARKAIIDALLRSNAVRNSEMMQNIFAP